MQEKQPVISYTLQDERGSSTRMRFSAKKGLTAVQLGAGADLMRSALSSISGLAFVRQSVTFPFRNMPQPTPMPGSDAEVIATMVFSTNVLGEYIVISLPGIKEEYILQEGETAGLELDRLNPDVINLISTVEGGLWCSAFGYDAVTFEASVIERAY